MWVRWWLSLALAPLCVAVDRCADDRDYCVCVPFYQCSDDCYVQVHGSALVINERMPVYSVDSRCNKTEELCCRLEPEEEEDPGEEYMLVGELPKGQEGCGVKRVSPLDNRFSLGEDSARGTRESTFYSEFPWMVALYSGQIESDNAEFLCGGSIILSDVVLTAAHCLYKHDNKVDNVWVRAGDWDTRTNSEPIKPQARKVRKVVIHDQFNRGNLINDIALLLLEKEFQMSEAVDTICLNKDPPSDINCQAMGWGLNNFNDTNPTNTKMTKVRLPIVKKMQCQELLRETRLGKYFKLHSSFICAGGIKNADTCKGDGGGPLICQTDPGNPYKFTQVGIVSWGIDCGTTTPGIYTSIAHFHDWIEEHIIL